MALLWMDGEVVGSPNQKSYRSEHVTDKPSLHPPEKASGPKRVAEPRGHHLPAKDEANKTKIQVLDYRVTLVSTNPQRAIQSIRNQLTHWNVPFPTPPENIPQETWTLSIPHKHVSEFTDLLDRKGNTHIKRTPHFVQAPAPTETQYTIRFIQTHPTRAH